MRALLNRRKINWRKGSSEMIGFALVLPFLCIIIMLAINIIQTGILRQSLEYTTYLATRAAVTSESESEAQAQARVAAISSLSGSSFGIDLENVEVNVTLVGGTSSAMGGGITWEKGALAKCEVVVPYESLLFGDTHIKADLYAMVERPARTY